MKVRELLNELFKCDLEEDVCFLLQGISAFSGEPKTIMLKCNSIDVYPLPDGKNHAFAYFETWDDIMEDDKTNKKSKTCDFCTKPCGNNWCPTKS
jgi:hypothetical protein